jgi:hypothetical protein
MVTTRLLGVAEKQYIKPTESLVADCTCVRKCPVIYLYLEHLYVGSACSLSSPVHVAKEGGVPMDGGAEV